MRLDYSRNLELYLSLRQLLMRFWRLRSQRDERSKTCFQFKFLVSDVVCDTPSARVTQWAI